MQPDAIETFLDLAETRSFHRTADRLGLTQSTVSARIASLEATLGTRLFVRSRAGTELTTEGLKFAPHARALRHAWSQAKGAVTPTGRSALNIRIGVQSDLAPHLIGGWVEGWRARLPECAFYIEPDFSAQMCRDLSAGVLDLAVLYTPFPASDLQFVTLGEARYRLVADRATGVEGLDPETYIRANFAPAFEAAHREALPDLQATPVASGQSAAIQSLLTTLGGAAYLLEADAVVLVGTGRFHLVADAPVITQPVLAATHLRHRTSALHRNLIRVVRESLAR